jgi:hypothetical protein
MRDLLGPWNFTPTFCPEGETEVGSLRDARLALRIPRRLENPVSSPDKRLLPNTAVTRSM